MHLKVGDLVKVHEDEIFPADLVLIATPSPEGICFVQTASLDGEKSLKKKWIPRLCSEVVPQSGSAFDFTGRCEADAPNRDLEKFHGALVFDDRKFILGPH
jgi:phospholipid-translocating ATPase